MVLFRAIEWQGAKLVKLMEHAGRFSAFSLRTIVMCFVPPWRTRLIFSQAYLLGLKALPVALLVGLFVGMVIVLQAGYQLQEFNAKQYAAGAAGRALTQVMIPIFTALVVGARTSASIAAELGTMRVTEQIDAMEILDVNPRTYLIVPRVIATTLMIPLLTIYTDIIGMFGGLLMGVFGFQISARYYITITYQFLLLSDVLTGLFKSIFFGMTMGICGCYFGFHASGGAEGVGQATTKAVVYTLTIIIMLEYILASWSLYVIDMFT